MMLRIGRAAAVAIGWSALVGCEPPSVVLREGPPPTLCAGPEETSCPEGQLCIDMPEDGCDPDAGGVDCDGICVAERCAGILALPCAGELVCVDDPDDDCDPEGDGSDCPGICVEREPRLESPRAPDDPCAVEGRVDADAPVRPGRGRVRRTRDAAAVGVAARAERIGSSRR